MSSGCMTEYVKKYIPRFSKSKPINYRPRHGALDVGQCVADFYDFVFSSKKCNTLTYKFSSYMIFKYYTSIHKSYYYVNTKSYL